MEEKIVMHCSIAVHEDSGRAPGTTMGKKWRCPGESAISGYRKVSYRHRNEAIMLFYCIEWKTDKDSRDSFILRGRPEGGEIEFLGLRDAMSRVLVQGSIREGLNPCFILSNL